MIFASKEFFIFLPIVLTVYHLSVGRSRKYSFLLIASWLYYAWIPPHYLWVILLLTVIDYFVGLRIERTADERGKRLWLASSVVSNLGLLFAFKYTGFFYENSVALVEWLNVIPADPYRGLHWTQQIVLPLGISYHTFQGISYTVDVYRKQVRAVTNFRDYALFVSFFPQLAAGPIVRAVEFLPQMATPPQVTVRQVSDGIALFTFGLFKKLVIADNLDELFVTPVFEQPGLYDDATHRWAVVAWAVQIYCDFSGYTDMALGTAKLFGFELPPNFRLPYLATSITDFWRRWHLSLSTWLRDYLYFPLGGSRHGALWTNFNLMLVFVLCGLWHGAAWNWLAYGVYNGVLMCLHRAYDRAVTGIAWVDAVRATAGWKVLAWVGTTYQFLVGLILVRMMSWDGGLLMMESLGGREHTASASTTAFTPWGQLGIPLAVPLLLVLGMSGHFVGLLRAMGLPIPRRAPDPLRMAAAAVAVAGVVVFSPGVAKSFIYIQF